MSYVLIETITLQFVGNLVGSGFDVVIGVMLCEATMITARAIVAILC